MKYRLQKNLDNYIRQLERFSNQGYQRMAIEKAIEEGSKVVDEETDKQLRALAVDNRPYVDGQRNSILQIQKNALIKAFGTSPIDERRNFINDKTGVDNSTVPFKQTNSRKEKKPQYVVTLARRLENGTSYMKKNPVFSRASRKARTPCLEAMQVSLNESVEKIFK